MADHVEKSEQAEKFWESLGTAGKAEYLTYLGINFPPDWTEKKWSEYPLHIRKRLSWEMHYNKRVQSMNAVRGYTADGDFAFMRAKGDSKLRKLAAFALGFAIGAGGIAIARKILAGEKTSDQEVASLLGMIKGKSANTYISPRGAPVPVQTTVKIGDDVRFAGDNEGTVIALKGNYATILDSEKDSHVIHINSLMRMHDLLYTDKGKVTWDSTPVQERQMICQKCGVPPTMAPQPWVELPRGVRNAILGKMVPGRSIAPKPKPILGKEFRPDPPRPTLSGYKAVRGITDRVHRGEPYCKDCGMVFKMDTEGEMHARAVGHEVEKYQTNVGHIAEEFNSQFTIESKKNHDYSSPMRKEEEEEAPKSRKRRGGWPERASNRRGEVAAWTINQTVGARIATPTRRYKMPSQSPKSPKSPKAPKSPQASQSPKSPKSPKAPKNTGVSEAQ